MTLFVFISTFMTFPFWCRKDSSKCYLIHFKTIPWKQGGGAVPPLAIFKKYPAPSPPIPSGTETQPPPSWEGKRENANFPTVMQNVLHLWRKFLIHSAVILQYLFMHFYAIFGLFEWKKIHNRDPSHHFCTEGTKICTLLLKLDSAKDQFLERFAKK